MHMTGEDKILFGGSIYETPSQMKPVLSFFDHNTIRWTLVADGIDYNYTIKGPRLHTYENITYVYTMLVPE